jgi:hypothetical protein
LPAFLPYGGRAVDVTLYCGEDRLALDSRSDQARLNVVLSKGYYECTPALQEPPSPEDRLETRLNGTPLEDGVYDPAWQDSQILFPEPQAAAGSLRQRPVNPEQRLLRISYPVPSASLRTGSNTVSVAVGHQAPHILRRFRIEKMELTVGR